MLARGAAFGRAAAALLAGFSPGRTTLARLRAAWAKPGAKDGWLASRYFDLTAGASAARRVDDTTWRDLELPKVFSTLDSTVTPLGTQALFRAMREYAAADRELEARYALYAALRADAPLREQIQLKLAPLDADSNAAISDYVFGPPPAKPPQHALLPWLSLASAATLVAVILGAAPFWLWLACAAVNVAVILRLSPQMHRDAATLRACWQMLRTADGLASLHGRSSSIPQLAGLAAESPQRAKARRALRWMAPLPAGNWLLESISAWANLVFLTELLAYVHTIDRFTRVRPELAATFELVGSLDAAIAVASYLERRPDHCLPELTELPLIDIADGHHPLLDRPVKNSVRLDGRSALITGSNMAGKTTFIKMVGVNVVLARTLGFCLASRATIPRSAAMASIRSEHSVESGKSHYFAEIEAIHSFIEAAKTGACQVFVIDELFNGTNTIERLAAARAVLEALSATAQVLVTTHDVELQAVLAQSYDLYHFEENPDVEGFFDYRLRPGATRARNALRLLERLEFPKEVVAAAMSYAAQSRPDPAGDADQAGR